VSEHRLRPDTEQRPVLVVQHEDDCPPAWFGDWMGAAGAHLDVRRPYAGEPLPDALDDHAGLLVLGGAMGAGDGADHPWLAPTKRLLAEACHRPVPTLGICLGHQLLAVAVGGRVERRVAGRQCGLLPVGWTADAADDPLFGPLVAAGGYDQPVAVQWNADDVTELPPDAVPLARTPDGAVQVMRIAPSAWGIQSHPEAGAEVVGSWMRDPATVGAAERRLLAALGPTEPVLRASWQRLAVGFARVCSRAPDTSAPAAR